MDDNNNVLGNTLAKPVRGILSYFSYLGLINAEHIRPFAVVACHTSPHDRYSP